jgi:hypothetical protein
MELPIVNTAIMADQGGDETILNLYQRVDSVHSRLAIPAITFRESDGLVMFFLKHSPLGADAGEMKSMNVR